MIIIFASSELTRIQNQPCFYFGDMKFLFYSKFSSGGIIIAIAFIMQLGLVLPSTLLIRKYH